MINDELLSGGAVTDLKAEVEVGALTALDPNIFNVFIAVITVVLAKRACIGQW